MKLELQYSSIIQGEFKPARVNIMLVMQVNCPGCLLYAIPALIRLRQEFNDATSFSILSTAFEDFELNTEDNTRRLVERGELVGETKRTLSEHYGLDRYHHDIAFTVLFDKIADKELLVSEETIATITNKQREAYQVPAESRQEFANALHGYFQSLPKAGYTFAANLLPGTPTFIVFNDEMEIIYSWFGHKDIDEIIKILRPVCSRPDDNYGKGTSA